MKHVAAVPKGFLRYYVLKLLSEKPMSGSEIMNELEKRTHGYWKPSPGSIYPLLSWLQEKGYSKEVSQQEPGMKRYVLTDQGRTILDEHAKKRKELRKRAGFFTPPFMGPGLFSHHSEKTRKLAKATKTLAVSSWELLENLGERYSEEAATKATEIIEHTTQQIDELLRKLKHNE